MNEQTIKMKLNTEYTRVLHVLSISLGACMLSLAGCRGTDAPKENRADTEKHATDAGTYTVFPLSKGILSSSLHLPGELVAFQQVDLYAKENSFVAKLHVDLGSEVSEGQLLAELEAPELGSQLAGAMSNVKSREAIYLASKATYDRLLETSQTPGTIAPNDLEQAAARKNADMAQWQAARSAYDQVADLQKYLRIRAPFSGVISARNVNTGAIVGPSGKGSDLPLFTLREQKRLRLTLSVPEAYTGYLQHEREVSFTVRSLPDQKFKAQVKRLSGAIDNRLRSEKIEMDVDNRDKRLLPGMVAEVDLPLGKRDSSFIVPKSAVVNSTESVFVIRIGNGKAEWVHVKTGREADGKVEIFGDLTTGDLLVLSATDEIRNGSVVGNIKHEQK